MAVDGNVPSTAIYIYTPVACGIFALTKGKVIPLSCVYPFLTESVSHPLQGALWYPNPWGRGEGIGVDRGEV